MINKRVLPGPTGREPFRGAGTFQGLSVNLEFVMSEHSVPGISNFRRRFHPDKVSDKASDKERKINPTVVVHSNFHFCVRSNFHKRLAQAGAE
jgi:hypothetical protein